MPNEFGLAGMNYGGGGYTPMYAQQTYTGNYQTFVLTGVDVIPTVEPEPETDPISWLKDRVQETIDEVDWDQYKAA